MSPETIEKIADILKIKPIDLFKQENSEEDKNIKETSNLEMIENQLKETLINEINKSFVQLKNSDIIK